jgi:hypothetical protein
MSEPEYITLQLRRPSESYPAGLIEEGFFIVRDEVVLLTTRDGVQLSGKNNRRPIAPGETAREVAVRLLRLKARSRPVSDFNRPLRYPAMRY